MKILKINIDKNQAVANKFSVRGIPTFILFQSNEIKWRKSGLIDENILLEELKKIT
ncbi:MAG: thioredoxin family protein [Bacteroidota bacterium]|nr:thioredoxin family protein [Bacteroidota bacterium]